MGQKCLVPPHSHLFQSCLVSRTSSQLAPQEICYYQFHLYGPHRTLHLESWPFWAPVKAPWKG